MSNPSPLTSSKLVTRRDVTLGDVRRSRKATAPRLRKHLLPVVTKYRTRDSRLQNLDVSAHAIIVIAMCVPGCSRLHLMLPVSIRSPVSPLVDHHLEIREVPTVFDDGWAPGNDV